MNKLIVLVFFFLFVGMVSLESDINNIDIQKEKQQLQDSISYKLDCIQEELKYQISKSESIH